MNDAFKKAMQDMSMMIPTASYNMYNGYIAAGFNEEQAFALASDFAHELVMTIMRPTKERRNNSDN